MQSPFKFLDAYDKKDRDIFFGRDNEVKNLYEKSFESNLILLYGASGTGKTSLINCGFCNKFQDTDWFSMFVRRGNNLLQSLDREIRRNSVTPINTETPVPKALRSLFYDHYKPIYLIFDQFEEIFILGDKKEQLIFFELLEELIKLNLQVTVILSMREEYIAYLSDYEKVVPSLFENRIRIEKMNRGNLEQVILGTTKAFNIEIENPDQSVSKMIDNLSDKRSGIDLTNLQVYLDRLYQEHGGNGVTFDISLINRVGELKDVLADFLEKQISALGHEIGHKDIPLAVLYTLITDDSTKKSLDLTAIRNDLPVDMQISEAQLTTCIRRFKEMRILKELSE